MGKKQLLVTSDDMGMCHNVNTGIVRAMMEGIVKSTNLMAPCPWFPEAATLCRTHRLAAGVHLCLTSEWDAMSWAPLTPAPSLRNERGYFPVSHEELALTARDEEIYTEFLAQIERVRAAGITPTHLDTHMLSSGSNDAHALRVQAIVGELAQRLQIPFTYETLSATEPSDRTLRHFQADLVMSPLSDEAVRAELESWKAPGLYHLIGHAADPGPELRALCSPEHPAAAWAETYRQRDLRFFTDPATHSWLTALGFELVDISAL